MTGLDLKAWAGACFLTLAMSTPAFGVPTTDGQSTCQRGQSVSMVILTPAQAVAAGRRLLVGIWWSGTAAQVATVTSTTGELFTPVATTRSCLGVNCFSVALYEAVAGGSRPTILVVMTRVPADAAGGSFLDVTLVDIGNVVELGNVLTLADAGTVAIAGPVQTVVPDELILAYAGTSATFTSVTDLTRLVDCFGDWTATSVSSTPGLSGGAFGQSFNAWATITLGLRSEHADAGSDAGTRDAGGIVAPDAGAGDGGIDVDGGFDAGRGPDGGLDAGDSLDRDGGLEPPSRRDLSVGCACSSEPVAGVWLSLALLLAWHSVRRSPALGSRGRPRSTLARPWLNGRRSRRAA